MKKLHHLVTAASVAAIALAGFGGVAYAGGSYAGFSTTVGKHNGNGYTGTQTKSSAGAQGQIKGTVVGGNHTVGGHLQITKGTGTSGAWVRGIDDGDFVRLPNSIQSGRTVRVHFNTNVVNPVNTQVEGHWRSQ